jgi:uncharacterized OsmC-like protein/alpha/beta superfamily hydrolase
MTRERVSFPGSTGARLAGRIEVPEEGEPAAFALFAHCFTCSKDLKSAGGICRELTARGIAVLRFDFTGLGESEGKFADTNFSSNVEDLVAAAAFLRRERRAPALLVGHSLGGLAMLAAAPLIPEAAAVATIGAPSDTGHLRSKLTVLAAADAGEPAAEVDLGGLRPVRIRRQLLDDLAADHLQGVLAGLGKALLLFHSPADNVVGIEHAERLFLAARHPKSFVSLGTADHLLTDPSDAAHVGAVLAAWSGRYLFPGAPAGARATGTAETTRSVEAGQSAQPWPASQPIQTSEPTQASRPGQAGQSVQAGEAVPASSVQPSGQAAGGTRAAEAGQHAGDAQAAEAGQDAEPRRSARALAAGEVEATGTAHSLRQEVRLGRHHLVADEPAGAGGADAGPTPYGLLLAALGACTGMTLRLYADRRRLPLAGTRVRLRHSRVHAADCEDCAESDAKLERIEREIELFGPLAEDQRARLLAIANRCPVHRTLTSQAEIVSRLI